MGPVWTPGRSFPQFPAATFMYVLPVPTDLEAHERSWRDGWRVPDNPDTMHALTLVAMQGIINRETPCVYLEWTNPLTGEAAFWATRLGERLTVERADVTGGDASTSCISASPSGSPRGDLRPEVPDTINVAMMLAGLEDRMVLAPQQLGQPGIPEFASTTDLRDLVAAQGWDTTPEGRTRLYQWVYEELWPWLDHRVIGVVSPGPPVSGPVDEEGGARATRSAWRPATCW